MRSFIAALAVAMVAFTGSMTPALAARGEQYPSFVEKGAVFCTDQLDFGAWRTAGRFHTRGGHDSCIIIDRLTRVALLERDNQTEAEIRVVSGPHMFEVGWTNAPLPVVETP